MTAQELRKTVTTEDGLVINHVGGKTRAKHSTCQVPVNCKLHKMLLWYLEHFQPHLTTDDEKRKLLFPMLNPWDEGSLDLKIDELKTIPYGRLLRGNRTRRHNVQLAHDLEDRQELSGTNLRELAALRCHSQAIATRIYDARSKSSRASRAHKALMESANRRHRLQEEEPDSTEAAEESAGDDASGAAGGQEHQAEAAPGSPEAAEESAGGDASGAAGSQRDSDDEIMSTQTKRKRFAEVYSDDSEEDDQPKRPATDPEQNPLGIGTTEESSGLLVDEEIYPFVLRVQGEQETRHIRSGKAWSVERATLKLALDRQVSVGKSKAEQVRRFLLTRPGWDMNVRKPLTFLAQLCKLRRK